MTVHKKTNIVHEEDDLVGSCYFEKWVSRLKRTLSETEIFLHVVSFVLLFVGTNDVSTIETYV